MKNSIFTLIITAMIGFFIVNASMAQTFVPAKQCTTLARSLPPLINILANNGQQHSLGEECADGRNCGGTSPVCCQTSSQHFGCIPTGAVCCNDGFYCPAANPHCGTDPEGHHTCT